MPLVLFELFSLLLLETALLLRFLLGAGQILRALVHQDRAKLTAALPQTVFLTEPMQEFAWE